MTRKVVFYDCPHGDVKFACGKIGVETDGSALSLIFRIMADNYRQKFDCEAVPSLRELLISFSQQEPDLQEAMRYVVSLQDLGIHFDSKAVQRILSRKIPQLESYYEEDTGILYQLSDEILEILRANPHPDFPLEGSFDYQTSWDKDPGGLVTV